MSIEWEERLRNISEEMNIESSKMPMSAQCRNIEVSGKTKIIDKIMTDKLFLQIHYLDMSLFPDKKTGNKLVLSSYTYMPFDAHYLLIKTGPNNLEKLTDLKLSLREMKKKLDKDEISAEKWLEEKKNVGLFLSDLKKQIFSPDKEGE